jgi:hypothetical protein
MPSSASLVPSFDVAVHIVLDDFGKHGRSYRETDEADATFDTVVEDMLSGQYESPVRVVAFNTAEGWARDISEDVAREVARRHAERGTGLDRGVHRFLTRYVDERTLAPADE